MAGRSIMVSIPVMILMILSDNDGDILMNSLEFYWDTDPFDSDTDQDGMTDGWEDFLFR